MLKAIPATTDPDAGFELDGSQAQLHAEQRQVMLPVGSEGISYQDAAEILENPVGTVRSRLSRATTFFPSFCMGERHFAGLCRRQLDARHRNNWASGFFSAPVGTSLPDNCTKGSCLASRPALVSGHLGFRHRPALPVLCGLSMAVIDQLKLLASQKAPDRPSLAAPADEDDLPMPSDIKAVFLGGLFLLAMLGACYVAAEILLPIVLAFVLSLVLQPAMRALERVYLARWIAALLVILVLFSTLGGLGTALSGPATSWAQKLPTGIPKLQERLSFLSRPIAAFQKFADQAQGLAQGDQPKAVPVAVQGSALSDRLLTSTRSLASGLLETCLCSSSCSSAVTPFLGASSKSCRGQKQATSGRHLPADRARCIGLPVYDYDHELGRGRGDWCRDGALRAG